MKKWARGGLPRTSSICHCNGHSRSVEIHILNSGFYQYNKQDGNLKVGIQRSLHNEVLHENPILVGRM